ncbi:hypothetical protein L202_08143 [Cryptococcus amylolentus CBS 6039]|uniref:U1 small nuclear ribonucleoprotein C n=2 Tax=Cryptococcus amylolentus TaxID=104669 RepID=A0A1E3H8T8_9TREE|nr:hypothetical protein L202_08143 [Cryptococcus amylolentus CBS 6039]ODN72704.1 hypothetical protein L202_08143 [Cryptococcus amylolentus CBS 6039]ODN97912.1 hypothetical protein I350_07548 [Cryptococcus amylolentus CBS 6273]
MGKYYCDYCDIYLTHDSMNARKAHNTGRNHIANVRDYFAGLGHNQAQSLIDQIIQQHESGVGRGMGAMGGLGGTGMRLGAGFMNPVGVPGGFPPPQTFPSFPPPGQTGTPPFRPPFPPTGTPTSLPPFPPPGAGMTPPQYGTPNASAGAYGAPPAFVAQQGQQQGQGQGAQGGFTPAEGVPQGSGTGIHPDRMRMLGA